MSAKQPLSVTHPELAKQAVDWDPTLVTPSDSLKRKWRCAKGHEFLAASSQRTRPDKPSGCPYCSGKKVMVGLNDVLTTHPKFAQYAYEWDPTKYSAGSAVKVDWKCPKGHVFSMRITDATKSKSKIFCKVCNGQSVIVGFNDLATTDPAIAAEAFEWDPQTLTRGSNRKKRFKCPRGHIYESVIATRALEKRGCRICRNQVVLEGFNDLASQNPQIASEADGWDPKLVVFGSVLRKNWKCSLGHTWSATIIGRTQGNKGCPYCSGFKTWSGFNDLATTHPHLVSEADGWDPTKIHAGTNLKLKWICAKGHRWAASGTSRSANNTGCPVCSNHQILVGFNDLKTTHPHLALEAFGWDPEKVVSGNNNKFKWKCSSGHVWTASLIQRSQGKETGCPTCASHGYDPNLDAWLYFLTHPEWELLQIGITNHPKQRLDKHQRIGWKIIEIRGPMDGQLTREWETSILQMLKKKGAIFAHETSSEKFDGYTEAWIKDSFPASTIRELMEIVSNNE
jgi:hypothetical protein